MQKVSFVIPLFNHLAHSQAMLASLRATIPAGLAYEIILIDDFSTDGTRAWLATLDDPHIKTLLNSHNLGYARSNNKAAATANGQILALLNNDLLLQPGWLEPMLALLQDPALHAGVVGNLQWAVQSRHLDHAGVELTPLGKLSHIRQLPAHTGKQKVLAVTAACCLVRKADFEQVGGFDEAYVNGGEDVDLCLMLRALGKPAYVATGSAVQHHVSLSRSRANPQNERNSRRVFAQWRTVLKAELTRVWLAQLQAADMPQHAALIDGTLSPTLCATPHALALLIAENMLQHEEAHWARTLDAAPANSDPTPTLAPANLQGRYTVHGLCWSQAHAAHLLTNSAELHIAGLRSARNVYVCGRTLHGISPAGAAAQALEVTLSVNGIQSKTFTLAAGVNMNVGIIRPLLLQGVVNSVKVSATAPVLITHFVVDDEVVNV